MTTSLPGLNWKPGEISLAERLGRESRERIADRMWLGTPFLTSVCVEADYIVDAWAHYDDEVQIRAFQIAFEELHRRRPKEPG
jgi:hypothetical protein